MNSQHKKLIALAAVVMLHAVVITLMLAQHGCKSDGQKSSPPDAVAAPASAATPAPTSVPVAADNNFAPPTRPAPEVLPAPQPLTQFEPSPTDVAPPSTMVAAPTPTSPSVTWTVVSGDSLSSIAKKNKITTKELIAANAPKVTSSTKLKIGQVLVIPSSSSAAPATAQPDASTSTDGSVYTVVAGDSLSKIASKNGTTVSALRNLNKLSTDTVHIGQKLNLPAGGAKAGTTAPMAASATTAGDTDGEYTVVAGDSLSRIASKTGTKTADLMSANGLTEASARNLHPGQKLKLPSGAHAAAAATTTTAPTSSAFTVPTFTPPAPGAPPPTPTPVMSVPESNTTTPAPITHVN